MDLSETATILFSPKMRARLADLAAKQGVTVNELVARACEREYGDEAMARRLAAARTMSSLDLPVGTIEQMKREAGRYTDEPPS